jgi:hypothetical protein
MTVSAEAEEKTEPNRVQKRRDLSFMNFKRGRSISEPRDWHLIEKGASQKETKTDTFSQKLIHPEMAKELTITPPGDNEVISLEKYLPSTQSLI